MNSILIRNLLVVVCCMSLSVRAADDLPAVSKSSHAFKDPYVRAAAGIIGLGALGYVGYYVTYEVGVRDYLLKRDGADEPKSLFARIAASPSAFHFAKDRLQSAADRMSEIDVREAIDEQRAHLQERRNDRCFYQVIDALRAKWGTVGKGTPGTWIPQIRLDRIHSQRLLQELCADPFSDFDVRNYDCRILRLMRQTGKKDLRIRLQDDAGSEGQSFAALFVRLSEHTMIEYLKELIRMFAGNPKELQKFSESQPDRHWPDWQQIDTLLALIEHLKLCNNAELRGVFVELAPEFGASQNMLNLLLSDDVISVDRIKQWFSGSGDALTGRLMINFLNAYPFESRKQLRRENEKQWGDIFTKEQIEELVNSSRIREHRKEERLRAVCENVSINWDEVRPAIRMICNRWVSFNTIMVGHNAVNKRDTKMLKDFFSKYGLKFHEEKNTEIEEHRADQFRTLIHEYCRKRDADALQTILQFLIQYPHFFNGDCSRMQCINACHSLEKPLPVEMIAAHVLTLRLNRYLIEESWASYVLSCCIDSCKSVSDEQQAALFDCIKTDSRYPEFLASSERALELFAQKHVQSESAAYIQALLPAAPMIAASSSDV